MTRHNDLAQRLIRRAARGAPATLAGRLEEEWLADLGSRGDTVSRLRLAIGCYWATAVITREFAVPQLVASRPTAGIKALLGSTHCDLPFLSRRTLAVVAIVGAHALLIYGFARGFAQHVFVAAPTVTHAVVIQDEKPSRPVVQMPAVRVTRPMFDPSEADLLPPKINFPKVELPVPEVPYVQSVTAGGPPAPAPAQPPIHRVAGGPGVGFPNTDDFYPQSSRRLEETGTAVVQVCVDVQGRLDREPVLVHTSGSQRLDGGALSLAKAGSGHYRPTTENGQPVSACYPYRIRFNLNN